jgi:carbonic anhydrase
MALPRSLIEGHRRFLRDRHAPERGRYIQLAELGQAPTAMVIACCDARVDVSTVFDADHGELFILRNVANLVPPYEPEGKYHGTSAGIEFAVQVLKVPHLIVLGHSRCGGVAAYRQKVRDKVPERGFIGSWLTMLDSLKIDESEIFEFGDETAFEFAAIRSRWRICAPSPSSRRGRRRTCSHCMASISISPAAPCLRSTRSKEISPTWMQPKRGSPRGR